ncbi:DUF6714 family protein [Xanthomonas floridensis]|uniref:DUF6714 family protein n=1 Tax=Xanthomonas floridensis TaxID=1843580 RepID=A0A1A9MD68_9XANT|nr:DUF6714 family protein [Xanthomonas floridensis]MEA5122480.1 DUF6714 family protein [Xanthomonas floridensis]MEA5131004.1 DUF6714 family protein [Xanthomonas floridensis]OAG68001.1 hypothetical protein A7D17_02195 [Xanthomonas floridensis]
MAAGIEHGADAHLERLAVLAVQANPPMSLRGGNAVDDGDPPPPFDPAIDTVTAPYLEQYAWGLHHLDDRSWQFYLPYLLRHAKDSQGDPASVATSALLHALRSPRRAPPSAYMRTEEYEAVVAVLDQLAFAQDSVWQQEAQDALEDYWGPGANYR